MPDEQEIKAREDALKSLERLQNFDVTTLPRKDKLGSELNFSDAVGPAEKLIGLYKQISLSSLNDLPKSHLDIIHTLSDADYNRLEEILKFSQKDPDPYNRRNALIKAIENAYQATFNKLHPLISYSASKSADFKRLENEARATMQTVEDQGKGLIKQLEGIQKQAQQVLDEARKVAAEQGVTQQASYFKEESAAHQTASSNWKWLTFVFAALMLLYAVLSLFIHKISSLTPTNTYESVQLAVSKVLIFAVISYMLYLSARNFLAHKHNAIVNKHRQNALMTYQALVEASGKEDNKEVILSHASLCIFGPQSTGYSRDGGPRAPTAKSVVELLTKPFGPEGD
jgi:hypothetical protein